MPATTPSGLTLLPESDTGRTTQELSDGITSINSPTIGGTADPGSKIQIFASGVLIATYTMTDATDYWTVTIPGLQDGSHSITAKAMDSTDNLSGESAPLLLVIDTSPPSSPSKPDLVSTDDTGASSFDNVTSAQDLSFSGTATSGDLVRLYDSAGTIIGDSYANATGSWNIETVLTVGTHSINARSLDSAGNESAVGGSPYLGTDWIIRTNAQSIGEDITVPSTTNGMTVGPVTISTGFTVTVDGYWSIV